MRGELARALGITGVIVAAALLSYAFRLAVWSWAIIAAVLQRGGV